jgi:hypothetical protein
MGAHGGKRCDRVGEPCGKGFNERRWWRPGGIKYGNERHWDIIRANTFL